MDKPLRKPAEPDRAMSIDRAEKISAVEGLRLSDETRELLAQAESVGLSGDARRDWIRRRIVRNP